MSAVIALFSRTPKATQPEQLAALQVRAQLRDSVSATRLAQAEARASRLACAGVQAQAAADRACKWALCAHPTASEEA